MRRRLRLLFRMTSLVQRIGRALYSLAGRVARGATGDKASKRAKRDPVLLLRAREKLLASKDVTGEEVKIQQEIQEA